jgi:vacuolar protein sorting-associated protein 18
MYLYYASVVGDHERVVEHWIDVEEWTKAIEVVSKQVLRYIHYDSYYCSNPCSLQNTLEMYYRFSPVLMRQAPKETTESWLRQPALDPLRLIPALLQLQHAPRDPLSPNYAVRYLNHVIFEQHNTSATIHNLILTFHAASPPSDDAALLRFLSTAPVDPMTQKPYYDLDYALRLCKQSGHIQPCVHIYGKMGLWENSVDLALEMGDLELAKINADMPEDDVQLRKKLWLKIARYVVQEKGDIKT